MEWLEFILIVYGGKRLGLVIALTCSNLAVTCIIIIIIVVIVIIIIM